MIDCNQLFKTKGIKMSKEKNTNQEESNEINFEETQGETETTEDSSEQQTYHEVVELEWEEVENLTQMKEALSQTEEYTSNFLLSAERRKGVLFARISEIESALYQTAQSLKESKTLNPDWTYELKLPEKSGEKGYFIRKEEN